MTIATWFPAKPGETPGPCDPEACDDPQCTNSVHLPDRDDSWSAADEDASWVEDDRRAERRADV